MAEKLGKKPRIIAYCESGERNIDDGALLRLHKILNVNINWMRTGEGEIFHPNEKPFDSDNENIDTSSLSMRQKFVTHVLKHMSEGEVEELLKYVEDKEAAKKYGGMLKKEQAG